MRDYYTNLGEVMVAWTKVQVVDREEVNGVSERGFWGDVSRAWRWTGWGRWVRPRSPTVLWADVGAVG